MGKGQIMTPEQAKVLCIKAHAGQFRRDGITPYHIHPIAVADIMTTDKEKIVAYLHDVIEDTSAELFSSHNKYSILFDSVAYEIPKRVYDALEALTKTHTQSYINYLRDIADDSNVYYTDGLSIKVKLADIFHNMSDNPTDKQKAKYLSALKILL